MKRSAAVVALSLAAGAFAQSGIPTGISATCNTFLTSLNSNQVISDCLTALIDQTSDFDPSTGASTSVSSSSVQNALSNICSASFNKCPTTDIRQMLADFYTNCNTDMLGASGTGSDGNKDVIAIYDVLYIITPLKGAICTKDGNQYCVNAIANDNTGSTNTNSASSSVGGDNGSSSNAPAPSDSASSSSSSAAASSGSASSSAPASSSASSVASHTSSASSAAASPSQSTHARRDSYVHPSVLYRRADNTTDQQTLGTVAPEAAQYNSLGLPYLFLTTNLTQAELCTTCTSEVLSQYISFESVTPYALGIANSPMLSGQVALWNKIKDCPNNFASNLLNNATGSTSSTGAAVSNVKFGAVQVFGAVLTALVGGVMLF